MNALAAHGDEPLPFNRADFSHLEERLAEIGTLDALVWATGTCPIGTFALFGEEKIREAMEVNFFLFVRTIHWLVKHQKSPLKVAVVSSVSANEGWAGGSAYCASKGALSAFVRSLQAELATRRFKFTLFEPRHVATKMFFNGAARMGVRDAIPPEVFAQSILESIL